MRNIFKNKLFKIILTILIIFTASYLLLMFYAFQPIKGSRFFIPEKYSGWICITYQMKDAPLSKIEDGFLVHKISNNGVIHTSSKIRTSPVYDEFYYYSKNTIRRAKELKVGGGFTSQKEGEKSITSYFWVSSGNLQEDYEKYVKDRDMLSNPPCGKWN